MRAARIVQASVVRRMKGSIGARRKVRAVRFGARRGLDESREGGGRRLALVFSKRGIVSQMARYQQRTLDKFRADVERLQKAAVESELSLKGDEAHLLFSLSLDGKKLKESLSAYTIEVFLDGYENGLAVRDLSDL